jgi:hypothetical protein
VQLDEEIPVPIAKLVQKIIDKDYFVFDNEDVDDPDELDCEGRYAYLSPFYQVVVEDGDKPYGLSRMIEVSGTVKGYGFVFTPKKIHKLYMLLAMGENGGPHHSYDPAEDYKFRRFTFDYDVQDRVQAGDLYVLYYQPEREVKQVLELADPVYQTMSSEEMTFWADWNQSR